MRFSQNSTIFGGFLEDLPFGEHTKDDDQKIRPCFQVSREFHRKKRSFFEEKRCFWKKPADLTRKRREIFAAIFCIFEKSEDFFRFWISEAATLLDDFEKYTKNSDLRFFTKKSWWAEKGEIHFFKKSRFFAKTLFAIFCCGGLMPKWKNKVEKCPVRNINFVWNTKNCHFLQNKPVGSEIGQKCKNRKNACFATAIWTSRTVVTKLRMLPPDAT